MARSQSPAQTPTVQAADAFSKALAGYRRALEAHEAACEAYGVIEERVFKGELSEEDPTYIAADGARDRASDAEARAFEKLVSTPPRSVAEAAEQLRTYMRYSGPRVSPDDPIYAMNKATGVMQYREEVALARILRHLDRMGAPDPIAGHAQSSPTAPSTDRVEADWSKVVEDWELAKEKEAAKAALPDDEFAAFDGSPEDEAQASAYWRAFDALKEATPLDARALVYQLKEDMNLLAFRWVFQNVDCLRSLCDLISSSSEGGALVRAYQSALRMAGETDHIALAARHRPHFCAEDYDSPEDHKAAWVRHHELFEAVEAVVPDQRHRHGAFEIANYRLRWAAADVHAFRARMGRPLTREDFLREEEARKASNPSGGSLALIAAE